MNLIARRVAFECSLSQGLGSFREGFEAGRLPALVRSCAREKLSRSEFRNAFQTVSCVPWPLPQSYQLTLEVYQADAPAYQSYLAWAVQAMNLIF